MLNDGSVHSQMVRDATRLISAGHLPLSSWFPYLQEGSPQFLHYQSLGSILTGLAGTVIGANRAYALSLYLLVALFPLVVYGAGRVFGLGRYEAAIAAVLSPFLSSVTGVGYEQAAYLWIGYGVWTQLFAMWTLPFAWAYGYRAVSSGRSYFPAVAFSALTIAFHFETGYLALIGLGVFCVIEPRALLLRVRRALVVAAGAALSIAWVLVPLLFSYSSTAINEALEHTYYADSYGARQALTWLVGGRLLDAGRLPVVSVLAASGVLRIALVRRPARRRPKSTSRREPYGALIGLFVVSLLLFFGRTTWGSLIDVLPASHDLFLRRFLIGVQLAALYLAGIGAVTLVGLAHIAWTRLAAPLRSPSVPARVPARSMLASSARSGIWRALSGRCAPCTPWTPCVPWAPCAPDGDRSGAARRVHAMWAKPTSVTAPMPAR